MMNEYIEAMNTASQSHLGPEIKTSDGVVFRRIIGSSQLKDYVVYSLPATPTSFRLLSLTDLEAIIGTKLFQSIFS